MARKYEVAESVGKSWEHVDSYESIEKHHPTWVEDPNKRRYAEIDGSREEYVKSPTHQKGGKQGLGALGRGQRTSGYTVSGIWIHPTLPAARSLGDR